MEAGRCGTFTASKGVFAPILTVGQVGITIVESLNDVRSE